MFYEVLGAELTKVRIMVELPRVEVEEDVMELVLDGVQGMNPTRVTRHRHEGVVGRGAESTRSVLHEVGGLVRRGFRHQLHTKIDHHHITNDESFGPTGLKKPYFEPFTQLLAVAY